jgi:hypothetical protein
MDYRIIFPQGDRTKLAIAQVRDYEENEWALASRHKFGDDKESATAYMVELATKHNLSYKIEGQQYLD